MRMFWTAAMALALSLGMAGVAQAQEAGAHKGTPDMTQYDANGNNAVCVKVVADQKAANLRTIVKDDRVGQGSAPACPKGFETRKLEDSKLTGAWVPNGEGGMTCPSNNVSYVDGKTYCAP